MMFQAHRARPNAALLWLSATLGALSCADVPEPAADVALRIAGDEVRYDQFETYLRANVGDSGQLAEQGLGAAVLGRLFDQFVDEQLLVRLAQEQGWSMASGGRVDHRDAVAYLLRAEQQDAVTEDAIAAYYAEHRAEYDRAEQVRLWQILVASEAKAASIKAELDRGEGFKAAVARLADDPEANYCGEQGLLAREDVPRAFADPIFALEPGQHSDVLKTDQGFYLFMVEERFAESTVPLESVAGEIRDTLLRMRMDQIMVSAAKQARARYTVRVFPSNLPFDYQGRYAKTESL